MVAPDNLMYLKRHWSDDLPTILVEMASQALSGPGVFWPMLSLTAVNKAFSSSSLQLTSTGTEEELTSRSFPETTSSLEFNRSPGPVAALVCGGAGSELLAVQMTAFRALATYSFHSRTLNQLVHQTVITHQIAAYHTNQHRRSCGQSCCFQSWMFEMSRPIPEVV